MTSGETDLDRLLHAMRPELLASPYVFVTVTEDQASTLWTDAFALIRETEGITVVLPTQMPPPLQSCRVRQGSP